MYKSVQECTNRKAVSTHARDKVERKGYMRQNSINKSLIMSAISIVILFSIYWMNGSKNIWHISITTVIGIFLYYVNIRIYQKAEVNLNNGKTYRRLKTYKVKKSYYLWIICSAILFEVCITGILNLPKSSDNEERINQYLVNNPVIESIINIGVLSPIVEEVISRGLLYMVCSGIVILLFNIFFKNAGRNHIDKTTCVTFVIISSISFGIPHVIRTGDYENIAPYILFGAMFSILYVVTKTIYVPILLHMLGNTVGTLGSIYKLGLIDINIAESISVFIFLYPLIAFTVWVWFINNDDEISRLTKVISYDNKSLGLSKSQGMKRQFKMFLRYVKEKMITRNPKQAEK